ncbi:hypothetical protein O9K51_03101 [Purpureocillium lavendulum]|uniref:Protein PBN1 n=1 Tax=Purpureocillium lavendulum TaxID=1247861 RepID=A0AB34G377_9HYPO|nr:hypothetical protein O9K51_03101 [Purpureocillium lavendulum]
MRERITFVQGPSSDIDPAALQIEEAGLLGPSTESVRQDRLSLPLDEVPQDLATLLREFDELHLQWASPVTYETLEPFGSRISPGLHVRYAPAKHATGESVKLCAALQAFGPLDCMKPEAFTNMTIEPATGKEGFYFFQELNDLSAFVGASVGTICSSSSSVCESRLRNLRTAASLDISYDSGSKTLKATPFWPLKQRALAVPSSPGRRTEVGIFAQDTPPKAAAHEIGVAGLLSVLGQQKEPSATVFSFPSRHRISESHFSSDFLEPAGLHPTLQLRMSSAKPPLEDDNCALHAFFTLPKTIFADRYQYEDELFLASKNLTASRHTSLPVDLEAPAYTTKTWGSSVLLELAPPVSGQDGEWTAEVPLHLRYLKPSASGTVPIEIPYPALFWACEVAGEVDFATNPFDRRHLGYDSLFSTQTGFWHWKPNPVVGNRITSAIYVPVLKDEGAAWIRLGTTLAVGLGFAWVMWKLLGVYMVSGYGSTDATARKNKKKSKLELLEQELRSIKQVVNPAANGQAAWTPPSPRATYSTLPEQTPSAGISNGGGVVPGLRHPPQVPTPHSEPPPTASSHGPSQHGSERRVKTGPTESRMLGSHVVSGEDVDWYFSKFLQCYHPFIPILRKRDPDECFEASPTLFWVILYVACRRYPRDRAVFSALIDHVSRDIWQMISVPAMNLDSIHALLFICTWPLPNIRFVTDPSAMFAGIATTSAKLLGCHTGRGSHPHFSVGMRQHFSSTDEEAASTWFACCLLSQRTTSSIGIFPPTIQHNDTQCRRVLDSHVWTDLLAMYEVQLFLNRFHSAMAAQIGANGGVPDTMVAMWETEFESLKPLLVRFDTDISRFCLLAAQLEIQSHYFISPPSQQQQQQQPAPPSTLKANTVRAFNTSRALIALSLDLESRTHFLTHAPQWALRSNVDAAAIIVATLASAAAPQMDPADADALAQRACGALLRCSVRDTDLPHRACIIMETFWSVRDIVPPIGPAPGAWPERLGAGVTYWCLERFKFGLRAAQSSTDRVNKALDVMQPRFSTNTAAGAAGPMTAAQANAPATSGVANGALQVPNQGTGDPFQEVDWSMFMDDFGWVGDDGVLLGLP